MDIKDMSSSLIAYVPSSASLLAFQTDPKLPIPIFEMNVKSRFVDRASAKALAMRANILRDLLECGGHFYARTIQPRSGGVSVGISRHGVPEQLRQ